MIRSIADFQRLWDQETEATRKLYAHLTDASLRQPIAVDHRTLGRIAWHVVTMMPDMLRRAGLPVEGITEHAPVPASAAAIHQGYEVTARSVRTAVTSAWTDAMLEEEQNLFGEAWKNGFTLLALVLHQAHHRGQMTVLMRQAGLTVPGMYGPAREEWAQWGMVAPLV
jgi:uncharacterized damage-inducible protein DinB